MGHSVKHTKGSLIVNNKPVKRNCLAQPLSNLMQSGCWKDQTCFIIGGGPSLINFDWRWLNGQKVIGTNKSFLKYAADINYSMDNVFFDSMEFDPGPQHPNYQTHLAWKAYKGVKVFVRHKNEQFAPGIYYVNALDRKGFSYNLQAGIYPGDNSGFGAMMLSVALGVKRIGLLGFDLCVDKEKTHWHEGYVGQQVKSLERSLSKFRQTIDEFASGFEAQGIQVVNLSPVSELNNYSMSDIKTFLT